MFEHCDNHVSRRHTRASNRNQEPSAPILPCSEWGLPARTITGTHRALLPHIFTLTN